MIPYIVQQDLDFQANWNPEVRARWGKPFLPSPAGGWHPCLRVRWVLLDSNGAEKTEYMRAQSGGIWGVGGASKIDGLIYRDARPDVVMHANVLRKPQIGMNTDVVYTIEQKDKFPFYYRYAPSSGANAKAFYSACAYFKFRVVNLVYTTDADIVDMFTVFKEEWIKDHRSAHHLITANVPSYGRVYDAATVEHLLHTLAAGATRVLFLFAQAGNDFAASPQHFGKTFGVLLAESMKRVGLWWPAQKIFANGEWRQQVQFRWNRETLYNASISWSSNLWAEDPKWIPRIFQEWLTMRFRVQRSDFYNISDRFDLFAWPRASYKDLWEAKVNAGYFDFIDFSDLLTLESIVVGSWLSDVLTFWTHALNHVMVKHNPTSKSSINPEMLGEGIRVAAPLWTTAGGTQPLRMNVEQQWQLDWSFFQWQRRFTPDGQPEPVGESDMRPVCCKQMYVRAGIHFYNSTLPRWVPEQLLYNETETDSMSLLRSEQPPTYLVNCTAGTYMLPTGVCQWCPPGKFSNTTDQTQCLLCPRGASSSGRAKVCEKCEVGKAASEPQSETCEDCAVGSYAKSLGQSTCVLCEKGRYSGVKAAQDCTSCNGNLVTADLGSSVTEHCICAKGTFAASHHLSVFGNTTCQRCGEGLDCDTDWPLSWNAQGNPAPLLSKGYYSLSSDPFSTYRCRTDVDCPGGPPESCDDGRTGLVCSICEHDGYFLDGSVCKKCPPYLKLTMLFGVLVAFLLCTVAYYAANGRLAVNADNPVAFFLFLGLVVTSLQVFGVFKTLSISWPTEFQQLMEGSSSLVSLDVSIFKLECAVGRRAAAAYAVQVFEPHGLVLVVFILFSISRLLSAIFKTPAKAWVPEKALNVCGAVMQTLFIAFCGNMVRPLECYKHPNGSSSMLAYPGVICFEEGEHTTLMLLGSSIAALFILPFIAWCVWGCYNAPCRSSLGDYVFLQRYRFLLYHFRPDSWWWGLCLLLRQTALAFATVVPAENPHGQLFYAGMILAIYGQLVCRYWPWIAAELSLADSGTTLALTLVMLAATQFLPEPKPSNGRFGVLLAVFSCLGALFSRYVMLVARSVCRKGIKGEFGGDHPDRMPLAKQWLEYLDYVSSASNQDIVQAVCQMNAFDQIALTSVMANWSAVARKNFTGNVTRLQGLPSRTSLDDDKVSEISSRVSRQSTRELLDAVRASQGQQEPVLLGAQDPILSSANSSGYVSKSLSDFAHEVEV